MNDKTTTAIAEYSPTQAALADLAQRMAKVVYDVSTPKGLAAAKADRAEVRDLRVALEKKRVEIKEPALTRCREIDTEAKRITAELLKYEEAADKPIKALEAKLAAERQALIDAEVKRMKDIEGRIAALDGNKNLTPASGSQLITEHIDDLHAIDIDDSFAEFRDTAELAKSAGLARLAALRTAAVEHEAAQAKLKKDQEELARLREEQSNRYVAERARLAAEDAEKQRKFDAERAEVMEKERVRQAAINAENARIAAEQRAAQEVIDKANRELESRQQAERDTQAKREREAADDLERMEREAEAQRVANYRPTFDEIVAFCAAKFGKSPEIVRTWICEVQAQRVAA